VHVAPFQKAGGTLLSGLRLLRLEATASGDRIAAAHCKDLASGQDKVLRAPVFVLAAGGVELPRLLLLSAQGSGRHAKGLGNEHGHVGSGFFDHLMVTFAMHLPAKTGGALGFPTFACDHFRAKGDRSKENTFYLWAMPGGLTGARALLAWHTDATTLHLRAMRTAARESIGGVVFAEMEASGTLTLDPDPAAKDAFGDPVAHVTVPVTGRDRSGPEAAARAITELAGAFGATSLTVPWRESGKYAFSTHPMGAARMAARPEDGVCDSDGKVFGVANLYLAGSALFPHFGAANPTLTLSALALRLAAKLGA
jgi:choline dehydrogenase-like flavoprotein